MPENSTITLLKDKATKFLIQGKIFAPFSGNKKYFSDLLITTGEGGKLLIDKNGIHDFGKSERVEKGTFIQIGDLILGKSSRTRFKSNTCYEYRNIASIDFINYLN